MKIACFALVPAALLATLPAIAQATPKCGDPAIKGQVLRYLTSQTPPPEASRYTLATSATRKWELGKGFVTQATSTTPFAVVGIPTMHEGDVKVSLARPTPGRQMDVLLCEYRRPSTVTDWTKVTMSTVQVGASYSARIAAGATGKAVQARFVDVEASWSDSRVFAAIVMPSGSARAADVITVSVDPVPVPPPPPLPRVSSGGSLSADVLRRANAITGGGYCWPRSDTSLGKCPTPLRGEPREWLGVTRDLLATTKEGNRTIAKRDGNGGTYCSGFTFSIAAEVLEANRLLSRLSVKEIETFRIVWYGGTSKDVSFGGKTLSEDDADERQSAAALSLYGLGAEVPHDQAMPGDFVQMWSKRSGHSAIFVRWLTGTGGKKVGFEYRGTQESTGGVGNLFNCFTDSAGEGECKKHTARGIRERVYFSRILAPKRS